MTENEFGAQYQPCRSVTFVGFDSDYHPDLYVDMQLITQICVLWSTEHRLRRFGLQTSDGITAHGSYLRCYDVEPEAGALHILSAAHTLFLRQNQKNNCRNLRPKTYFKNKIGSKKKLGTFFPSTIQALFLP